MVMPSQYGSVRDVWSARLYHYQTFDPAHLESVLRDRKVYCADPNNLNDPWDCKPWFGHNSSVVHADGFSKQLQAELARRRIYCLTPYPLSTLMWSHYAKNHTGICLEFHVSNHLFLKAMPVSYEIKYPQFHIDTMYEHATQVVLTKADCWRYEDEFRLIASPDLAIDNPLRLHDGMYLRLPLPSLLSVIVGCEGDYAQVKSVVDKHSPGMRVIRIVRANDEY